MTSILENSSDTPQWKKDLIARLRNQNRKSDERLWLDHHPPYPKTDLVCPPSPENGFDKDRESSDSSEEDLHYGPGIVNKLKNKYLSLALRESNSRPTILRKATSLENLLDEDESKTEDEGDGRLFRRRGGGKDSGPHSNRFRSSNRRQEMKRARSVEAISRINHEEVVMTASVTSTINNRQSLHEEMLIATAKEAVSVVTVVETSRSYKKTLSTENGFENSENKYNGRINRPKRIQPLLNEKEKPPLDVVKQTKMIFEKRPDQRTRKPPQTGDVAAKVDSFNNIIVKAKVALKKPPIKHAKPVLSDKNKSNTHHAKPAAKPVILSEEISKPRTLDLKGTKRRKREATNLPSPIPDVSRIDHKNPDGSDSRTNSMSSLCETPDLILTSSPVISSPTYKKNTTEKFLREERNSIFSHAESTNRYISPINSPTRVFRKSPSPNFFREAVESPGIKPISPISQNNVTKSAVNSSVFNFTNSEVDQKHLPTVNSNVSETKTPVFEPLNIDVNGFAGGNKIKMGLSAIEIEKNLKNSFKSSIGSEKSTVNSLTAKPAGKTDKNLVDTESVVVKPVSTEKIFEKADSTFNKAGKGVKTGHKAGKSSENVVDFVNNAVKISEPSNYIAKPSKTTVETVNKSSIHHMLDKPGKNHSESSNILDKSNKAHSETTNIFDKSNKTYTETSLDKTSKTVVKPVRAVDKMDRDALKPVQASVSASGPDKNDIKESEKVLEKILLPKKPKPKLEESNTAVFNFTTRKDVPDYIANDTSRTPSKPVLPKPGEGGIIIIPDAISKAMEFFDEEEEILRSLEGPPSPCDVTFLNDNILIDGKSSLSQSSMKRIKLKISFVDSAEIFEYPSETSLLLEDSPLVSPHSTAPMGHTVPTLSGSSLATYTPKTMEEFQLGITRTIISKPDVTDVAVVSSDLVIEEVEQPVLFSSGGNSDILF